MPNASTSETVGLLTAVDAAKKCTASTSKKRSIAVHCREGDDEIRESAAHNLRSPSRPILSRLSSSLESSVREAHTPLNPTGGSSLHRPPDSPRLSVQHSKGRCTTSSASDRSTTHAARAASVASRPTTSKRNSNPSTNQYSFPNLGQKILPANRRIGDRPAVRRRLTT